MFLVTDSLRYIIFKTGAIWESTQGFNDGARFCNASRYIGLQ
jgi:hypothetical protein